MSVTDALSRYDPDVPSDSWLTGDKAYNDYTVEDVLREVEGQLLPKTMVQKHHYTDPVTWSEEDSEPVPDPSKAE